MIGNKRKATYFLPGQRPFFPHCWIERLKYCCDLCYPRAVVLPEALNSPLGRTRQDRRAAKGIGLRAELQGESLLFGRSLRSSIMVLEVSLNQRLSTFPR